MIQRSTFLARSNWQIIRELSLKILCAIEVGYPFLDIHTLLVPLIGFKSTLFTLCRYVSLERKQHLHLVSTARDHILADFHETAVSHTLY